MVAKFTSIAMMLCMITNVGASPAAIGTAVVRGDLRVDGYAVKGDATLFDGSVVETQQDSAVLRLQKGGEVKLATSSRGVLHRDRMVLEHGQSEWAPTNAFLVEADGLKVVSSQPNSRGMVSVGSPESVQVAAVSGEFRVTNEQGVLLASVRPGHALSFDIKPANEVTSFTGTGTISSEGGHYYITLTDTGAKYEVTGAISSRLVGKVATIQGTIDPRVPASGGAIAVVDVSRSKKGAAKLDGQEANASNSGGVEPAATSGGSVDAKRVLIFAALGAAGVGAAIAIDQTNNGAHPASR